MPQESSPSNGSRTTPTETAVATVSIVGGAVLRAGESDVRPGDVDCAGPNILAVHEPVNPPPASTEGGSKPRVVDAAGCWVLPGLVDLHGDAFERSLMPRPGVAVDIDLALLDNDRQLLAAGITTSFLSATDSWEPGLRSRATLRTVVAGLARRTGGPDVRLHVRHERCQVHDLTELESWIDDRVVGLLSFNDHTPGGIADIKGLSTGQIQRSSVPAADLERSLAVAVAQRPVGLEQERRLAQVAAAAGCPTASHDPSGPADLARDLELGVAIAEFPMSIPLAHEYREHGIAVLLGAPNLVRGGSHLGNLAVADALAAGACDLLCSDYHYPSLLQTAVRTEDDPDADFARRWGRVSGAAAAVAGLEDRGTIFAGARADLVVIEPPDDGPARVRSAVVAGRVAFEAP